MTGTQQANLYDGERKSPSDLIKRRCISCTHNEHKSDSHFVYILFPSVPFAVEPELKTSPIPLVASLLFSYSMDEMQIQCDTCKMTTKPDGNTQRSGKKRIAIINKPNSN